MITVTEAPRRSVGKVNSKPIPLETFKKKYLERKTYKYEWKQGWVEKKDYMKSDEQYIIDNIITKFNTLPGYQERNRIMAEADCYFSTLEAYRRPDAAYLTRAQIKHPDTASEAPALVIEVSSPSNTDLTNKKEETARVPRGRGANDVVHLPATQAGADSYFALIGHRLPGR